MEKNLKVKKPSLKSARFKVQQAVEYYGITYIVEEIYPTTIGFFYKLIDRLGKVAEGALKRAV